MTSTRVVLLVLFLMSTSLAGCGGSPNEPDGGGGDGADASSDGGSDASNDGGSDASSDGGSDASICTDPETQCPVPDNECLVAVCEEGACATEGADYGTPTSDQSAGDCMISVCDGEGGTTLIPFDDDPFDDGSECTADSCDEGTVVHTPVAGSCVDGSLCADPSGPKAGQCVECNVDAECESPNVCDPLNGSNTCVPPSCMDLTKNQDETGIDCGGSCGPCANGLGCLLVSDCQSRFCDEFVCAACEADADCASDAFCDLDAGGVCTPDRVTGTVCARGAQCASGFCADGVCCNGACGGLCEACNLAGSVGTCSAIANGVDPANECPGAYVCAGSRACEICGDGVQQSHEACDDGNLTNGDGCENDCTPTPLPNPIVLCATPNQPITGWGPGAANPANINVPHLGTVTDVDVSIRAAHTWPGDLRFSLSHGGVTRVLVDRVGIPSSSMGCSTDNVDVTLDDEGPGGSVENVCRVSVPGVFSPPSRLPQESLASFDGLEMQGVWSLVTDDFFAPGDDGTLQLWCVTISWE